MKRKKTLLLAALLIGTLLVTSACSLTDTVIGKVKELAGNKIAEAVEDQFGEDSPIDLAPEEGESPFMETDEDGSMTFELEEGEFVTTENEIPQDYPFKFCPPYKPAKLISAQKYENGNTTVYILMLVTKDDQEMVKDFYSKFLPDPTLADWGLIVYESEDGKSMANVVVTPAEGEHAEKGNQASIMVTVTVTE